MDQSSGIHYSKAQAVASVEVTSSSAQEASSYCTFGNDQPLALVTRTVAEIPQPCVAATPVTVGVTPQQPRNPLFTFGTPNLSSPPPRGLNQANFREVPVNFDRPSYTAPPTAWLESYNLFVISEQTNHRARQAYEKG